MGIIGYKLTELAESDLENIFDYTLQTWGERQAKDYFQNLLETIDLLTKSPEIGTRRQDYFIDCLVFNYHKYQIFYSFDKDFAYVARILHQSMDMNKFFKG
jgi:toxin ParE1/3/4